MTPFDFFGRRHNHGPGNFSDKEFIAAVRQGGVRMERATDHIIHAFGGYKWTFHRKYGLKKDDVVDAFTDAVMTIIHYIQRDKLDRRKKISTLLYTITRNKCVDIMRQKGKSLPTDSEDVRDHNLPGTAPGPEQNLIHREAFTRILRMLESWKGNCPDVLLNWGFWGYKMEEIAALIGLQDYKSAKATKFRCLKRLRDEIAKDTDFPNPIVK